MSADRSNLGKKAQLKEWLSFLNQSAIPLPMIVFTILAIAVLAASTLYQDNLQHTIGDSVERISRESQLKTTSRFDSYEQVSRSGTGLIRASGVDNISWSRQLGPLEIAENYPSIQAIGYAAAVNDSDKNHSFKLSNTYPQTAAKLPSIKKIFTDDSVGLKKAMLASIESGDVRLSEAQPDKSCNNSSGKCYIYMFTPVYKSDNTPKSDADRQANLEGVIFIVSDVSTFFDLVYADHHQSIVAMTVSQDIDGKKTELYSRGSATPSSTNVTESQTLDIMGQRFYYDYVFSKAGLVSASQRYVAVAMPFLGLVLSLLLALVISFSLRARNQRQSMAKEREVQAAKDELLSLASHQLRTPATGVKQYLGMVLQGFAGNISDTQRDFLDKAYSSNERQLHIINDILYLAKLDAGRIVLTKSRFDLVELIKSVADELHDTAQDAGLSPTVSLPSKAPIVGDSHMIRMVVENLMTNAIKYTDSGGKVEVKLIRSGENYLIKVTDSGVGIASKDISKLFAQFTRIPNERSSQVSGTGVGLYLARSLTRLHGGDVEVRSKLGEGSTFTIKIPRGL